MKEIKIFRNYGCLAAEKRNIYTYGNEAGTGDIACETPWGGRFGINQLLEGNEHPYFAAYDNNGKRHRVRLKTIDHKMLKGGAES